ncbi:MAG: hypothetical protein JSU66_15340 [Deltaproteobacteria bacterium]|nr:MAG: hypothetical protein JSU66_15340 [Deltaproteobacteria bacterium]
MPLSPLDDLLAHQTTETFDYVFTSDRNFYDRYYFNAHASSDELFLVAGMGQYPNLGVTDAFASISHGDTLYVVRASRELGSDRLDTTVGPFGVEVVEGLRTLRLRLDENEWGVAFDLTFEGVIPALLEPKHTTRQFSRITMDSSRFAQVGRYSGTLTVAGQTYAVTPDRWKGVRDRSWGIRPVGEPVPPGIGVKVQRSHGFFHNWIPMQFDDFMIKVFFEEDADGNRFMEESKKIYNLGIDKPVEELGEPRHAFTYTSGTRELEKAVITFDHPSGEALSATCHPLRTVYLAAGSGYLPAPDWGHGMYRGERVVQGLRYDVGDPAVRKQYSLLNETLCRFELSSGEVGYGMHENMCLGIYRPYGFDAPEAVAP